MRLIVVAILIACFIVALGEKARFDNYRVFSVSIKNEKQLNVLRELEIHPDGILFRVKPMTIGQTVNLLVPPHKQADIDEIFAAYKFNLQMKTEDLQK